MTQIIKPAGFIELKPGLFGFPMVHLVDDNLKHLVQNHYVDIASSIFYFNGDVIKPCECSTVTQDGEFFYNLLYGMSMSNRQLQRLLMKVGIEEVNIKLQYEDGPLVKLNNGVPAIRFDMAGYQTLFFDVDMNFWLEYPEIDARCEKFVVPIVKVVTEKTTDVDPIIKAIVKHNFATQGLKRRVFKVDDRLIQLRLFYPKLSRCKLDLYGKPNGDVYVVDNLGKTSQLLPDHNDMYYVGKGLYISKLDITEKLNPKPIVCANGVRLVELNQLIFIEKNIASGWFIDEKHNIYKEFSGVFARQSLESGEIYLDKSTPISVQYVIDILNILDPFNIS